MRFAIGKTIVTPNTEKPSAFPSKTTIAANAAKALLRNAGAVARFHRVIRSTEEQDANLAICEKCEKFEAERCTLCGCFLRFKTALSREHCPIGKW
jgi:hypothetical protein